MTSADQSSNPLASLQRKQARRKRLTAAAGTMVGAVFLLRAIISFLPHAPVLKTCDDNEVQRTVKSLMDEVLVKHHLTTKVAGLSNFQTKQRNETLAQCTATVNFSDSSKGVISYKLDPKKVEVVGLAAS